IENNNWILLSTYDTEIRWQKHAWEIANYRFDDIEVNSDNILSLCKSLEKEFSKDLVKKYANHLVGSRITFEIPLI
ncbi:MAG: hypothetical protein JWQ25_471, partial [Daejeonella sp.]|nr:hypothetical protein [Daejeonella sp.]